MVWGIDIEPTATPAYDWDSWKASEYIFGEISDLPEDILQISTAARMALTIAIAEIVHCRLASFDVDGDAQDWITASWAFLSPAYVVDGSLLERPEIRGPGPEPIRLIATILHDMQRAEGGPDRCVPLIWMYNLAAHVLDDYDYYDRWFLTVLDRLVKHHTEKPVDIFEPEFPIGMTVDRSLFDVSESYVFDPSAPALSRYLKQFAAENPYIVPSA